MEITNKRDVRLVGRAIREGWPVSDEVKKKVVAALVEIVDSRDPDLMLEAIDRLQKADKLNIDRETLLQKQAKDDDDRRLQLLELARHIEPRELAKLASQNGIAGQADATEG